jgi:pyridoxamine 5'-phosphate oxidase
MNSDDPLEAAQPLELFERWLREATASEPNDPNAAALATANVAGEPSVRMVLVKRTDHRGFCFFTNAESQKGCELSENPQAALCFHWKTLRRQVRVAGPVTPLADAEVDEYFHSRSRGSQTGAAVSQQSRPLASREDLEHQVKQFIDEHPGNIPRPGYWRGYCVEARRVEFWMDGPDRLHDRIRFTRTGDSWERVRLYP